jgi:uncharacterized membrane protein
LQTGILVVGISLIPYLLLPEGFWRLILVGVASTITFFVSVWFIGLSLEEKEHISHLLNAIVSKIKIKP